MKKILLTAIFILLFMTSCTPSDISTAEKIVSPINKLVPISGEWKVADLKPDNAKDLQTPEMSKLMGVTAVFDREFAAFGDDTCTGPLYKIKNVNAADYLLYQYKIKPDYLGIISPEIQVVSVSSNGRFFYEFIKTQSNEIITNMDGVFYYLKKVSDDTTGAYTNNSPSGGTKDTEVNDPEGTNTLSSGILLGLRSPKKETIKDSNPEWEYRTLWISSEDNKTGKIYGIKDLFVPRKSGFWRLGVIRNKIDSSIKDMLFAYPAGREPYKSGVGLSIYVDKSISIFKTILYAGNDYVSTEYQEESTGLPILSTFRVVPMDNVENVNGVKISDIAGDSGRFALNDGAARYTSTSTVNKSSYLFSSIREENFAVSRRNGHWIMKGRLNSSGEKDPHSFVDFNIKAIPPSKLVTYDDLCLSWNFIKGRVPEAVDAYTSPNKDLAVIITNTSILVYTIKNNTLSESPDIKLKLNDKEVPVMSEWASGKYTTRWEKELMSNGGYEVNK